MIIDEIINRMIMYNSPDIRRINHALKVYVFAKQISDREKCDDKTRTVIEISSILHDIGIHNAEKIYNSNSGTYQEIEGPKVSKEILKNLEIKEDIFERVLFIIGNHHSYGKIDGIDFQILVEADFIVNIFEDEMELKTIESIYNKVFKTKSGIELLRCMYMNKKS
jgi:HD superfamily phosphohydrolase